MISLSNPWILRLIVILLAPVQWVSVFWYVDTLRHYPDTVLKRLIPWAFMMLVNVVTPIGAFLLNSNQREPDEVVKAVGSLEGLVFVILLLYGLKKVRNPFPK
ncbi:MAG: hypothetical protein M0037_03430 [Betaproteobacteria bacterium]|nr:hypothetical protein [Betaproteobacteria bacterium]